MTSLMLYFFLIMDSIVRLFIILSVILGILIFINLMVKLIENKFIIKRYVLLVGMFIFSLTLTAIIPNTKQAAIIFGVPYLMENAEKIHLDKLPVKVVNYLNVYLDQELEKITKKDIQPQK